MKQWTVTYREKSGLKTSVVIEAEDRAGVFAELKQRGINAISITEGAVKAKRKATGAGVSKGVWGVVAAVVAVALVVIFVVAILPSINNTSFEEVDGRVNVGVLKKKKSNSGNINEDVTEKKISGTEHLKEKQSNLANEIELGTNKVEFANVGTNSEKNVTRIQGSVFSSPTDQLLAMVVSSPGGVPGPPIPLVQASEKEFRESLKTPIEILETDSPKVVEIKQKVIAMRLEMKELLDSGMSFNEVIKETQADQADKYSTRMEAQATLKEFLLSGDYQAAERFCNEANEILAGLGVEPLKMPSQSARKKTELLRNRNSTKQEVPQ